MLQSQATETVALHVSYMVGKLREDSSLFFGGSWNTLLSDCLP